MGTSCSSQSEEAEIWETFRSDPDSDEYRSFTEEMERFPSIFCKVNAKGKYNPGGNPFFYCCCMVTSDKKVVFTVTDCGKRTWKREVGISSIYRIKTVIDVRNSMKWKNFFYEFQKSFRGGRLSVSFTDNVSIKEKKKTTLCILNVNIFKIPIIKQSTISLKLNPQSSPHSDIGRSFFQPLYEYYHTFNEKNPNKRIKELERDFEMVRLKYYRLVKNKKRKKKHQRKKGGLSPLSGSILAGAVGRIPLEEKSKRRGEKESSSNQPSNEESAKKNTEEEEKTFEPAEIKPGMRRRNVRRGTDFKALPQTPVTPSNENGDDVFNLANVPKKDDILNTPNQQVKKERKVMKMKKSGRLMGDQDSDSALPYNEVSPPSTEDFNPETQKKDDVYDVYGVRDLEKEQQKNRLFDKDRILEGVKQLEKLLHSLIASQAISNSEMNSLQRIIFRMKKEAQVHHLYSKFKPKKDDVVLEKRLRDMFGKKEDENENTEEEEEKKSPKTQTEEEEEVEGEEEEVEEEGEDPDEANKKNIDSNNQPEPDPEKKEKPNKEEEKKEKKEMSREKKAIRVMKEAAENQDLILFSKDTHEYHAKLMIDVGKEGKERARKHALTHGKGEDSGLTALTALHQEKSRKYAMNLFNKVDEWNFDVFLLDEVTEGQTLFMTGYSLFMKYDFIHLFNIPEPRLIAYLKEVACGYRQNPYHNAMHAADVSQISHYFMQHTALGKHMTDIEKMGLLVASLIHDYDHPGLNNKFHIRNDSYLALLYNDRSILENHHLAHSFELIRSSQYNIFQSLSKAEYKVIRKFIIEMVLATDMEMHQHYIRVFLDGLGENEDGGGSESPEESIPDKGGPRKDDEWEAHGGYDLSNYLRRTRAAQIVIKIADVSNSLRPGELYLKWAGRIKEEFYNQGDREREMGMSVSPFMDRNGSDLGKLQQSFMNFLVRPMIEVYLQVFPSMKFVLDHLAKNNRYWNHFDDADTKNLVEFEELDKLSKPESKTVE